jgi:hypothetical protein
MVAARQPEALRAIAKGGLRVERWSAWYGSRDHSLEEACSAVGDALDLVFEQREDPDRGRIYVSERADGEIVKILPRSFEPPHEYQWWPRPPVYHALVRVRDSSRWIEVHQTLTTRLELEYLFVQGVLGPLRQDCYGWGDMPLAESAAILGAALRLPFVEREGLTLGIHWSADGPGVEVDVRDNYEWDLPHLEDEEIVPQEPDFPEHRRLVYMEGQNLGWFAETEPLLAGIPGLVRLSSEVWGPPGS